MDKVVEQEISFKFTELQNHGGPYEPYEWGKGTKQLAIFP